MCSMDDMYNFSIYINHSYNTLLNSLVTEIQWPEVKSFVPKEFLGLVRSEITLISHISGISKLVRSTYYTFFMYFNLKIPNPQISRKFFVNPIEFLITTYDVCIFHYSQW